MPQLTLQQQAKKPREFIKKVAMIGLPAVGKTSVIKRYVVDLFDDEYISTIGTKVTKHNGTVLRGDETINETLLIWDVNGSDLFRKIWPIYYQGSGACLVVCENTNDNVLGRVAGQIALYNQTAGRTPMVFLLNKEDLYRKQAGFNIRKFERFAEQHNGTPFVVSAKTGKNVKLAMDELEKLIAESIQ